MPHSTAIAGALRVPSPSELSIRAFLSPGKPLETNALPKYETVL